MRGRGREGGKGIAERLGEKMGTREGEPRRGGAQSKGRHCDLCHVSETKEFGVSQTGKHAGA